MIKFQCDYMEGAHPEIMRRLNEINLDKNDGYGLDHYSAHAMQLIREACQCPKAEVRFLVGGTQTNAVVIDSMLRFNEGIIAAQTGHINVHEAGAIEACGHKVIPAKAVLGKIDLDALETYLETVTEEFNAVGWEHYVVPRAIYVSMSTELGTLYSLAELTRLRDLCDRFNLYLYIDGARLGYALAAPACDVTLPDVARLADVFYIGGTKVGALFGEAVVVTNPAIQVTRGHIKGRGAMLAKGWLLGIQFETLFTDGLYFKIARNAVEQALKLRDVLIEKGYEIYLDSPTNQQFVVMPTERLATLAEHVGYDVIVTLDAHNTVIRFCTSWATTDTQLAHLISCL